MKTILLLSVLLALSLFASRTSAEDSATVSQTNRMAVATNATSSAGTNSPAVTLDNPPPITFPIRKSEWDKTDFWTTVNVLGNQATDTFTYSRWSSRTGRVEWGPIICSEYACRESGIAREDYFGGVFLKFKLR